MKKFIVLVLVFMSVFVKAQEAKVILAPNVIKHQRVTGFVGNAEPETNRLLPPNVVTPTGSSTDVGITEGTLSVSLAGAANYNVPITVPKGITGVEPKISLNYSSQGGNGMAGYGWEIGGLSAISRIPSSQFHDGVIDPVDGDNLDRFALDGQRLILKNPTGTTYLFDGASFETENFSNLKITYKTATPNNYFLVEYPDGSSAKYGNTADSQNVTTYAITEWKNAVGIPIYYSYIIEFNFLRINTISYGSLFGGTQLNVVTFNYTPRLRPIENYVSGILIKNNQILTNIVATSNSVNFKRYTLNNVNNQQNLDYQRLVRITEDLGNDSPYIDINPTVFAYGNTPATVNYGNIVASLNVGSIELRNSETVSGDFDGDGKMDFILYPTTGASAKSKYWLFNDITNPGSIYNDYEHNVGSFVKIFPTSMLQSPVNGNYKMLQKQGWCVVKVNAAGQTSFNIYSYDVSAGGPSPQYVRSYGSSGNPREFLNGDFNGDGLTDVIIVDKTTSGWIGGFAYFLDLDRRLSLLNPAPPVGQVSQTANSKFYVSDVNGDGKSDLMIFDTGIVKVYSLDSSNQLVLLWQLSNANISIASDKIILLGDYNGDGKSDFMIPSANGSSTWYKFTSTGTNFIYQSLNNPGLNYQLSTNYSGKHFISTDFNHDGKSDIVMLSFDVPTSNINNPSGTGSIICYPNLDGFFNGTYSYAAQIPDTIGLNQFNLPFFFTSDRPNESLEIGFIKDNKIYCFKGLKDFNIDKQMQSITTGNGVSEFINYKPLKDEGTNNYNNPNIYKPASSTDSQNYPFVDIISSPSMSVVSSIERYGNNYKKQYFSYYGGVYAMNGLGYMGFQETMRTNWFDSAQPNQYMISNISRFDMSLRGANVLNFSAANYWSNFGQVSSSFITKNINTYNMVSGIFVNPLQSNNVFKLSKTKIEDFDGLKNTSSETNMVYNVYNSPTSITGIIKNGITTEQTSTTTVVYDSPVASPYVIDRPLNKQQSVTAYGDTRTSEDQFTYTAFNQILTHLKKSMSSAFITTGYEYDNYGNTRKETVNAPDLPVPRIANFEFSNIYNGRFLTKATDIEGLEINYTYDNAKGNLITETNPFGLVTTNAYDSWGKKTAITDYLNNTITINYNKTANNTFTITKTMPAAHGGASTEVYDVLGRKIITGEKNIQGVYSYTKTDYNNLDLVVKQYEPYFLNGADLYSFSPTNFSASTYDPYPRLSGITYNTGKTETIVYNGLTTTVTTTADGVVKEKATTTDAMGNMKTSTETTGVIANTINYAYYANGALKSTSFSGNTITTLLDNWGRKSRLVDPSAGTYNYSYNNLGEILTEETPKGLTTYGYDNFGKILTKTVVGKTTTNPSTTTNTITTNTYYPGKLLHTMTFNDVENNLLTDYEYNYNTFKQPILVIEKNGMSRFETEIQYDSFGRPFNQRQKGATIVAGAISKQSEKWTTNVYQNGALFKITDGQTPTGATLWQNNETNERGQLTKAQYGNGIYIQNTYDAISGAITNHNQTNSATAGGTSYFQMSYNWTNFPQRNLYSSRTFHYMGNYVENFTFDDLDRLTSYPNAIGTIENQTYADNGRIAANSNGAYNYSVVTKPYRNTSIDVNATSKNYYQNSALQQIVYSALKKPISIYQESTTGVAQERINFLYNAGESRSVMFYGDTNTNKLARKFRKYYSQGGTMEITEERDGSGNVIATNFVTYIGGDGYTAPIVLKSNGTVQNFLYLHRDNLGSILAISDQSKNILEKRVFDAWGSLIKLQNSAGQYVINNGQTLIANYGLLLDRGYTGHEHLFGVGLINMNGRLYDPKLHRFLMPDNNLQDPTNSQNYNRYGYVLNNPLMYIDPTGEDAWSDFRDGVYRTVKVVAQGVVDVIIAGYSIVLGGAAVVIGLVVGTVVGVVQYVGSGFQDCTILNNEAKLLGGLFQGNAGQIFSRFTKELPQTLVGLGLSLGANALGRVRSVSFYGGATVVEHYHSGFGAFTLGSYINGQAGIEANDTNALFMHEYGHYLQSQDVGWRYMNEYALTSLLNAISVPNNKDGHLQHDAFSVEQDANIRAVNYFGSANWNYNVNPIFDSGFNNWFDLDYKKYR